MGTNLLLSVSILRVCPSRVKRNLETGVWFTKRWYLLMHHTDSIGFSSGAYGGSASSQTRADQFSVNAGGAILSGS